jgi:hypothetical protein
MLSKHAYSLRYLFSALENGPPLLQGQLRDLAAGEVDYRPDAERFTIREVVAHLADWEGIFFGRLRRMRTEEHPSIPGYDEGDRAIEQDYASTEPLQQARLFAERRAETVAFLHTLQTAEWERTALRPEIGVLTMEDQALLLPLHDSYHLRQVAEWKAAWKSRL